MPAASNEDTNTGKSAARTASSDDKKRPSVGGKFSRSSTKAAFKPPDGVTIDMVSTVNNNVSNDAANNIQSSNSKLTDPRSQFALRMRADSSGSTRGALFKPEVPKSTKQKVNQDVTEAHERYNRVQQKKRRSSSITLKGVTPAPVKVSSSNEQDSGTTSMADLANLAMQSMEEGREEILKGLQSGRSSFDPSLLPPHGHGHRHHSEHAALGLSEGTGTAHAPTTTVGVLPKTLETIRNESSSLVDDTDLPRQSHAHSSNVDSDRFTADSLRVSDNSMASLYGSKFFESSRDSMKISSSYNRNKESQSFLNTAHVNSTGGYGSVDSDSKESGPNKSLLPPPPPPPSQLDKQAQFAKRSVSPPDEPSDDDDDYDYKSDFASTAMESDDDTDEEPICFGFYKRDFDPILWLTYDAKQDENGNYYFDDTSDWNFAAFVRWLLYDPITPEFTSLQQFSWAVIMGVIMGIYTAFWKMIIEGGLDFFWKTLPTALLRAGLFTDPTGIFPLYHYMWICPAVFGGVLSYLHVVIKMPDQNEWINSLHSRGVQDHQQFFSLWILSTLAMVSGLSLGPELPLVLTSSMFGSYLGLICKQSMLQARVLNLTAAGAAVGGFFGFPMAGALFVLELPHRMGLQYFEALSPATIASIVAVLVNRMVVGSEVTGYYRYPFLTSTLPSTIFTHAIVYGLFGAAVGVVYALWVLKLKTSVHNWFSTHQEDQPPAKASADDDEGEKEPLMGKKIRKKQKVPKLTYKQRLQKMFCCTFPKESTRASVAGIIVGILVGAIAIFVPHTMFWGEAQLQNLIDRGRTPLPVFGIGDEPTAVMTSLGYCVIDSRDPQAIHDGFDITCSALISVAKTIVVGLSLGTGIAGGQFWGPLFVGCSASHFLTDFVNMFANWTGFGRTLAAHPCVVILCTMGSAHVVTFRAHMAIMLILTLTISAFNPENDVTGAVQAAGDYSAVFPLLVVSVFVSLMVSRQFVFYKTQRSRGDIMAVPEVLCEPGLQGRPMVLGYNPDFGEPSTFDEDDQGSHLGKEIQMANSEVSDHQPNMRAKHPSQANIERDFLARLQSYNASPRQSTPSVSSHTENQSPPTLTMSLSNVANTAGGYEGLDELLTRSASNSKNSNTESPIAPVATHQVHHRRSQSAPVAPPISKQLASPIVRQHKRQPSRERWDVDTRERFDADSSDRSNHSRSVKTDLLVRIDSYGEIHNHQPSLMEQARLRAATGAVESRHTRVPSLPSGRHSRKNSESSFYQAMNTTGASTASISSTDHGGMSIVDYDKSFDKVINNKDVVSAFNRSPWTYGKP